MHTKREKKLFISFTIIFILLLLLFVYCTTLDDVGRKQLLSEDGPVEIASAVLYFFCFGYILLRGGFSFCRKMPYFVLLPLLFGMRELDFDKRFTTTGIFKSKFYLTSMVPLPEKLIVLAILLPIIAVMLLMLKNHLSDFWNGLLKRDQLSSGVLVTLATLVTSKTLDGLERKCTSLGVALPPLLYKYSSVMEEVLELGIPLMMLLLFSAYFSRSRHHLLD